VTEFEAFKSIARLNRKCVVTEKLDGTNAQVMVTDEGHVMAGSRNRWLTLENDNFGFAGWVERNKAELVKLGPGRHFGEWWGNGIQRRYGLAEKRFSLFNVEKWSDATVRPECCHVVPVLAVGELLELDVKEIAETLRTGGSVAAPGFMNPEGIVIYHSASNGLFKFTLDKNDAHKGSANV